MVRDKYYLFFSGYLIIHATGLRRSNTKKAGDNMKQIVCFGDSNTYGLIPILQTIISSQEKGVQEMERLLKKMNRGCERE